MTAFPCPTDKARSLDTELGIKPCKNHGESLRAVVIDEFRLRDDLRKRYPAIAAIDCLLVGFVIHGRYYRRIGDPSDHDTYIQLGGNWVYVCIGNTIDNKRIHGDRAHVKCEIDVAVFGRPDLEKFGSIEVLDRNASTRGFQNYTIIRQNCSFRDTGNSHIEGLRRVAACRTNTQRNVGILIASGGTRYRQCHLVGNWKDYEIGQCRIPRDCRVFNVSIVRVGIDCLSLNSYLEFARNVFRCFELDCIEVVNRNLDGLSGVG